MSNAMHNIKIFADGADSNVIASLARDGKIAGFTTNPSLMRAVGVPLYRAGALVILAAAAGKPVSIEILSDNVKDAEREARGIAELGSNAVVKVPVVNSKGASMVGLIAKLAGEGLPLNVTAVFTRDQVVEVGRALGKAKASATISIFAGRIADTGVDPLKHVSECRKALRDACPSAQMLWASSRQVYDVALAQRAGCEIITLTPDLIAKLQLTGKDLGEYSNETAAQFLRDAAASGYAL